MAGQHMIRLEDEDNDLLTQAAYDYGVSPAQMGRLIIQNYLQGYRGPYVMRAPLANTEASTVVNGGG